MNETTSEALVVSLFFVFRVLLVGGILLALPRIQRKGLLFGVYVGETVAEGAERRRLLRDWLRGVLALMATALAVGLSIAAAGHPLTGNLTGTAVLLVLVLPLYVWAYRRARALAPSDVEREAARAAAPLAAARPRGLVLAWVSLAVCLLAGLSTAVWAVFAFEAMPARVPDLASVFTGRGDVTDRSAVQTLFFPLLNLLFGPLFALIAVITTSAKLSVRQAPGESSFRAQEGFRTLSTRIFAGGGLLLSAYLTFISVQVIRVQQGAVDTAASGIQMWLLVASIAIVVFLGAGLVMTMTKYGQGGARLEGSVADRPLAGGLADNAHWVLGLFYVDRSDPSLLVEKRFGIGYTLNYGNRAAFVIAGGMLLLLVSVVTLGVLAFAV